MPQISNNEGGLSIRNKFNANGTFRNNNSATVNPAVTDDTASGYEIGSRWINTTSDEEFVCLDNTTGAAVWASTTLTAPVDSVNGETGAVTLTLDDFSDSATVNKFTDSDSILKLAGIEANAQVNTVTASSSTAFTNKTINAATGGNNITNISLATGVTGNLPTSRLAGGAGADSSSFWRGDGSWAAPSALTGAQIKSLNDAEGNNVNQQTGTSYILILSDLMSVVTMDNSSANTLTIPANASVAFPIGTIVSVTQLGGGVTTIEGAVGVTLTGNGGSVSAGSANIQTRYNTVSLTKIATDQWLIVGDITTVS